MIAASSLWLSSASAAFASFAFLRAVNRRVACLRDAVSLRPMTGGESVLSAAVSPAAAVGVDVVVVVGVDAREGAAPAAGLAESA